MNYAWCFLFKTIARVTRDANGDMAEYKLPIEMPAYLGSGSEFIPVESIDEYPNHVLKLDELGNKKILIGYIFGGIESSGANIFFINTGTESSATARIFEVYVQKGETNSIDVLNPQSVQTLQMQISPNPNKGKFMIQYHLKKGQEVDITIQDAHGKTIETLTHQGLVGLNEITSKIKGLSYGSVFFIKVESFVY